MTMALFVAFCAVAVAWVTHWVRSSDSYTGPLAVAWQLAALSFITGPESLGDRGSNGLAAVLLTGAVGAVAVHGSRQGWRVAYTPWMALYGLVLAVAAVASSSPIDATIRTGRTVVLFVLFSYTAAGLARPVLRRLFAQFVVGCAGAITVSAVVDPGSAFRSIKAPVIDVALTAPALGFGAHWVAAVAVGLIGVSLWNRSAGAIAYGGAGLGLAMVMLSQKRAFWLAATVALLVWILLHHRRRFIAAAATVAVVATLFVAVTPLRDLWDREQSRPGVDNILSVRQEIFDASIDRFEQRPVIGDGLGVGNRDLLIDVGQPGFRWASHGELGAVLAATGLAGFGALLWGHVHGVVASVRAWRREGDALPLIVVCASVALLPFWRILQEPLLVGLAYFAVVLPEHRWRRLGTGVER